MCILRRFYFIRNFGEVYYEIKKRHPIG